MDQPLEDLSKIREALKEKIKSLPVGQRRQAVKLYNIFTQIAEVKEHEDKETDAVYQAYDKRLFDLTTQMDEIIEGKRNTTAAEFEFWKQSIDANFVQPAEPAPLEHLPHYWKKYIFNNNIYTGEHDEKLLNALTNISTSSEEVKEGDKVLSVRKLICKFAKNEFFKNEELTVSVFEHEGELTKTVGTKIDWTNNPTVQKEQKKKKNKKTGETKVFTKEVQLQTFFEIFEDYDVDNEDPKEDEEEEEKMDAFMVQDILNEINDTLPYSLEYFLDLHEKDFEDEDGDEDDEEEEEEEDKHKAPKKKAVKNKEKEEEPEDEHPGRHKKTSRKTSDNENKEAKDPKKENPECKKQ